MSSGGNLNLKFDNFIGSPELKLRAQRYKKGDRMLHRFEENSAEQYECSEFHVAWLTTVDDLNAFLRVITEICEAYET
jgi:hypothetical protein